jgi:hypothetical protein
VGIIDATECPIQRPSDYEVQKVYYNGKKKHHALKYDMAICPYTKRILWISGGVASGVFHDLKLAEIGFFSILEPGEKVLGDKAYIGNPHVVAPVKGRNLKAQEQSFNSNIGVVRVKVENVFAYFKRFSCLKQAWRHSRSLHPIAFSVIVEIANIELSLAQMQ